MNSLPSSSPPSSSPPSIIASFQEESARERVEQLFDSDQEEEDDEANPLPILAYDSDENEEEQEQDIGGSRVEHRAPNADTPRRSSRQRTQTTFISPSHETTRRNRSNHASTCRIPPTSPIQCVRTPAPALTYAVYTDGSYTPLIPDKLSKAGWGVVLVKNGGLEGPDENHGDVIAELGGKVATRKGHSRGQFNLGNEGGIKSNNTAELTAVGEAILYLLQELKKPSPPPLRSIVIRSDSAYAEGCIKGVVVPDKNKQMTYEIRRHFRDLKTLCTDKDITLEWSHVEAHVGKKWNCRADALAKMYADPKKNTSKRALDRNPRQPTVDINNLFTATNNDIIAAGGDINTINNAPPLLVLDPNDVPEDANLIEYYARSPIHQIPAEHVGILCDLLPTKKFIRQRNINRVRACYIFLLNNLKREDNRLSSVWWRKCLFLPRVLFTPTDPTCYLTLTDRCNLVLADDWTQFTLDSFLRRQYRPPGPVDQAQHDTRRVKASKHYLKDGEISRSYRALQSNNVPIPAVEDVFQKMNELYPERNNDLPPLPNNLPDLEINSEIVETILRQTKNSVTNCPITSLRYEHLKKMIGRTCSSDEM